MTFHQGLNEIVISDSIGHVGINYNTKKPSLLRCNQLRKINAPKTKGFVSLTDMINEGIGEIREEIKVIEYNDLQELGKYIGRNIYRTTNSIKEISFEPLEGYRKLNVSEKLEYIAGLMQGYLTHLNSLEN
ncbi:hypothetical protein HN385_00555 [archaeon]|jgi:hypothetical protein|nr:hypothetical protein [archaeon]MBT3451586.1 hypothetical protein [archaeon]MBT6869606.1 hypothetical protein [archaeon]MBT7192375.1 hypothetical protein [archaeon]MBT7380176.1 hypothetical protein [archaeon]